MGYRLHVAKTYKVEYSEIGFNWMSEEVNRLLVSLHNDLFACDPYHDGEMPEYSEYFEFDKENWRQMIAKLREKPYKVLFANKNFTGGKMADVMQEILDKSDSNNGYIVLHWF